MSAIRLIPFFMCLIGSGPLLAQELLARIRYLTVEDGLSGRFIQDISKDDRGFIWILTNEAVNRYDGDAFKTFSREVNGLKENIYDRVFPGPAGRLWLVNYAFRKDNAGITRYIRNLEFFDPVKEMAVPVPIRLFSAAGASADSLTAIAAGKEHRMYLADRKGDIYVCDTALTKVASTGRYINYILPPVNETGTIWCISNDRLLCVDPEGKVLDEKKIQPLTGLRKLSDTRFALLYHHEKYFFDQQTGILDTVLRPAPEIVIRDDDFYAYSYDPQKRIWGFSPKTGFSVFDPETGWLVRDQSLDAYPADGGPEHILWDSETTAWISFKSMVGLMVVENTPFRRLFTGEKTSMRGIVPVNDSIFLALSYSGIRFFNRHTLRELPAPFGRDMTIGISAAAGRGGDVWIGLHAGRVLRFNMENQNKPQRFPVLFEKGILVIEGYPFVDRRGKVWLGSNQGLFYLDEKSEAFKRSIFSGAFETLNSTKIQFFQETDEGIWMATEDGLVLMDEQEKVRAWYKDFPEKNINHFLIDPEGVFWMATRGSGLLKWTPDRGVIGWWDTGSGLSNNFVHAVYRDRKGYLWLPTNYGLNRLDPEDGALNIYLEQDGIAHNEFNVISNYQDDTGNLYLGGLDGLTIFNPDQVNQFHLGNQPSLEITEFLELDSRTGNMVNKTADLINSGRISVKPGVKALQLRFALLDYGRIGNRKYAYRIDGVDKDWTYINEGYIRLNQLPYGRLALRIKGLGRGGEWSEKELLIPLEVLRPFYLRAWFLIVCLLALIAAVRAYFVFRVYQLKKEKEHLEQQVAERTSRILLQHEELKSLNGIKDRLFSIIGHELRGPLVYFRGISRKLARLIEAEDYGRLDKFGKSMDKAALSVGDILDNLLNWGVIQNKHIPYKPVLIRLDELLRHTLAPYIEIAGLKQVEFTICPSSGRETKAFADPNALRLIVQNLANNAVKFTPGGGRVMVKYGMVADRASIEIADTGIGIPDELADKVFTLDMESRRGTEDEKGTGLGLVLCKELAAMNGGSIFFTSTPGNGTVFTVSLPGANVAEN